MLHRGKSINDLAGIIASEKIFYGESRLEGGEQLHIPFQDSYKINRGQDYDVVLGIAHALITYMHKASLGNWDYNAEKASEVSTVCGDNPGSSGIIVANVEKIVGGERIHLFLSKTFGTHGVLVGWLNDMAFNESLLKKDFPKWLKEQISGDHVVQEETTKETEIKKVDIPDVHFE